MEGKRRGFNREVKVEAVRLVTEGGMAIRRVARDLDTRPALLSRWTRKSMPEGEGVRPEGAPKEEKQEL